MATLLSMAIAVARDVGGDSVPPTRLFGNPDKFAQQLLRAATRAARRVFNACDWALLIRENTFNSANGTAEYSLPSDFGNFIDETAWDRATYLQLRGPLSARDWQIAKSGIGTSVGIYKRWRVKRAAASIALKFVIDPTPTAIEAMVFEYQSNSWATATDGTTLRTDWVADTDIPLLSSDLIELDMYCRMLPKDSAEYAAARKECDARIDQEVALDGGMPVISLAPSYWDSPQTWWPQTGFGS